MFYEGMIYKQEVKHIAKLAKLKVAKKEEKKFQEKLSSILGYVEKLKEIDVSQVGPCFHPVEIENIVRQDKKTQNSRLARRAGSSRRAKHKSQKLMDLIPEKKNKYVKVKAIL